MDRLGGRVVEQLTEHCWVWVLNQAVRPTLPFLSFTSPAGQMASHSDFCSRGPRYDTHW